MILHHPQPETLSEPNNDGIQPAVPPARAGGLLWQVAHDGGPLGHPGLRKPEQPFTIGSPKPSPEPTTDGIQPAVPPARAGGLLWLFTRGRGDGWQKFPNLRGRLLAGEVEIDHQSLHRVGFVAATSDEFWHEHGRRHLVQRDRAGERGKFFRGRRRHRHTDKFFKQR